VIEVRWSTDDPAAVASRLRGFGLTVGPDGSVAFPGGTIRVVLGPGPHDRLELVETAEAVAALPPPTAHPNGVLDLLVVGLATVDRERALGHVIADGILTIPRDPHLGATASRDRARPDLLVLEPDTEGRLAATLARHGEGPAAIYLRVGTGGLDAVAAHVRRRGGVVSTIRPGPLGRSVILLGGPPAGPHLLVVEDAS
jgi:hypothetical protein